MSEVRKPSYQWYPTWQLEKCARILDPDGWDRDNWEQSWNVERITYEEFCDRAMHCTLTMCDVLHVAKSENAAQAERIKALEEALAEYVTFHSGHVLPDGLGATQSRALALLEEKP